MSIRASVLELHRERDIFVLQVSIHVRVAFFDVDSTERIHYTAVMRYMEIAEHALMRSIGFPCATTLLDITFPRVHVECDFHGAIRYDDELMIDAYVDSVGRSSWKVVFSVRGASANETEEQILPLLAKGQMVMVAMDPKTQQAQFLPNELREALLAS